MTINPFGRGESVKGKLLSPGRQRYYYSWGRTHSLDDRSAYRGKWDRRRRGRREERLAEFLAWRVRV